MATVTSSVEAHGLAFNYSDLDRETCKIVQEEDTQFDRNMSAAGGHFLHACRNLLQIHRALRYARPGFVDYCRSKPGLGERTAYRMLEVARMFAESANIPSRSREALYLLAAPSTPEAARQEAVARASTGEVITHGVAQSIVQEHRGLCVVAVEDEDGGVEALLAPTEDERVTPDAIAMLAEHLVEVRDSDSVTLEEAACVVAETETPWLAPGRVIEIVQHYQATIADELPVSPTPPVEEPLPTAAESPPVKKEPDVEWYTPADYIAAARAVLGTIDLDPASCAEANETVQAPRFYTEEDDGLTQPWHGRIWCNPPYIRPTRWIARMIEQYQNGAMPEGLLLLNSSTGSEWFQPLWAYPICFVANRINFQRPAAKVNLERPHYDSVIVYFGPNVDRFTERFRAFGPVVQEVVR